MNGTTIGEQEKLSRRARILLLGAVSDVGIGAAVFLWGDLALPAARMPGIELTLGQLIGAVFVFVAAPVQFLLYSRVKSRVERAIAPSGPSSGRNGR